MDFENELSKALRRQDPSAGFAERVAARAEASGGAAKPRAVSPVAALPQARWRMAWAVGMAALLAVGLMVNAEYRQMRAERAAREATVALRIAAEKLNFARVKVLRLNEAPQRLEN